MVYDNVKTFNGDFAVEEHCEHSGDMTVRGNLTLGNYSSMYSKVTIEKGTVSLGDYAFINELHMPYGGEIFFHGKRPVILHLEVNGLIVHIPEGCTGWTNFVQINNARSVIVRRDID